MADQRGPVAIQGAMYRRLPSGDEVTVCAVVGKIEAHVITDRTNRFTRVRLIDGTLPKHYRTEAEYAKKVNN